MSPRTNPLLDLVDVHKSFGGVRALRGASFTIAQPGEIHGLLGENGSGKSTLLGIVSGQARPDRGVMRVDGGTVTPRNAASALDMGIAMVSQEVCVAPDLSVTENILLGGRLVRRGPGIDWRRSHEAAAAALHRLGIDYDPRARTGDLRPDQQQMVEIARALSVGARIIILDEPTSSLTDDEVVLLLATLRHLRDQGVAIVFVSHRLNEVLDLCDEITVLRDGSTVAQGPRDEFDKDSLVGAMIGPAGARASSSGASTTPTRGSTVMAVSHVSDGRTVYDASFEVAAGQVVGVVGAAGSGRSELLELLFGARAMTGGSIEVQGRRVTDISPRKCIRSRVGYLPPDRKADALVQTMNVGHNLTMMVTSSHARLRYARPSVDAVALARATSAMRLTMRSARTPVYQLSGGNQQKVAIGKWLGGDPLVLLLDEPTRGVDVGAKADIHARIRETAQRGTGVVVTSSDSSELLDLCDELVVLRSGRVAARLQVTETSAEHLIGIMGGHS